MGHRPDLRYFNTKSIQNFQENSKTLRIVLALLKTFIVSASNPFIVSVAPSDTIYDTKKSTVYGAGCHGPTQKNYIYGVG
jgi:Zn-dependent M16 (insulinase) family peptidase